MATAGVRVLDVLIASPSDARPDRDIIERTLRRWNETRGDIEGVILRPLRWEIGAAPISGRGDPQSVINEHLVARADILIAVFYHILGSPNRRAVSGTIEEVQSAIAAGKGVHVYFPAESYDVEPYQMQALESMQEELTGLAETYDSETELEKKVREAIERDVGRVHAPPTQPPDQPTILLVFDNSADVRSLLSSLFGSYDITVFEAASLEYAQTVIRQVPFDLIVIDSGLVIEGTGADLIATVKRYYRGIPLAIYSHLSPNDYRHFALEQLVDVYMAESQTGIAGIIEWVEKCVNLAQKHFEASTRKPDTPDESI